MPPGGSQAVQQETSRRKNFKKKRKRMFSFSQEGRRGALQACPSLSLPLPVATLGGSTAR